MIQVLCASKRNNRILSNHKTNKVSSSWNLRTLSQVAFLCDITGHLNSFSLQLHGRASSARDLFEKVCACQRNLEIFQADLTGKMLHFPTLHVVATDETSMEMLHEFLNNLIKNFKMGFENFKIPKDLILFVVSAGGPYPSEAKNTLDSINEGAFLLESVRLQS